MIEIKWDKEGYPTKASLRRLRKAVKEFNKEGVEAFYAALQKNWYGFCWTEFQDIGGELKLVLAYHTGGWSGNEEIIAELQRSPIWGWALERYDAIGHYYFRPKEKAQRRARGLRHESNHQL